MLQKYPGFGMEDAVAADFFDEIIKGVFIDGIAQDTFVRNYTFSDSNTKNPKLAIRYKRIPCDYLSNFLPVNKTLLFNMDKFLQILEDGRLTDGKGETVYFSETFIIFTSNIGAANADVNWDTEQTREYFIEKVKEHFINELKRPEILNRIGDANIVPFNFIQNDQVLVAIGKSKFTPIREFVKERYKADIRFDDEDAALNALGKSVNKANGGRGMLNAMEQKLINPLSDFVFEKMETLERGGRTIKVNIEKTPHGEIEFDFCLD